MIRVRVFVLGLIALIGACSTASQPQGRLGDISTEVVLPPGSGLTYEKKSKQEGYFYFGGQLKLTGLILVYWQALYLEAAPTTLADAKPVREMYMRFYPDAQSQEQLPVFNSTRGPADRPQRIFLYRTLEPDTPLDTLHSAYSEHEVEQVREIVQHFSELPVGFLEYREGFAIQPARIVLQDLISYLEADHRFLYARGHKIEPLSITDYGLHQLPDSDPTSYLGRPWVESFYAPGPLIVRDRPAQEGRVIAEFPEGVAVVEKVRTVDENWVMVRMQSGQGDVVKGFVQPSELLVVN